MGVTQEIIQESVAILAFRCAKCDDIRPGNAVQQRIEEKYFGLIPLNTVRLTTVNCPTCKTQFRTKRKIEDLEFLSPDQIAVNLKVDVSGLLKFMVIIGCLFFFIPFLGLGLSLVSYFKIQQSSPGWRRAALIGMILGGLFNLWFAYAAFVVGF